MQGLWTPDVLPLNEPHLLDSLRWTYVTRGERFINWFVRDVLEIRKGFEYVMERFIETGIKERRDSINEIHVISGDILHDLLVEDIFNSLKEVEEIYGIEGVPIHSKIRYGIAHKYHPTPSNSTHVDLQISTPLNRTSLRIYEMTRDRDMRNILDDIMNSPKSVRTFLAGPWIQEKNSFHYSFYPSGVDRYEEKGMMRRHFRNDIIGVYGYVNQLSKERIGLIIGFDEMLSPEALYRIENL